MTVLVTGAGGTLGRYVLEALNKRGVAARGCGRGDAPGGVVVEWRRADLVSGVGLAEAVTGVEAVVHCATAPLAPAEDLAALERLIEAIRPAGTRLVYVGIAGIEGAAAVLPYYRVKLECERFLAASEMPFTICRASQFHPFVAQILKRLGCGPIQLCPPMTLQPVDPRFVAERLVDHALNGATGRVADVHGPEAIDMPALVEPWLHVHARHRVRLPIPAVGPLAAFARLRVVNGDTGGLGWREWIARTAT